MRTDSLREFIKLRNQLVQEKSSLEARLRDINQALGEISAASGGAVSAPAAKAPAAPASAGPARRGRRGGGGGGSLREHVLEVLKAGPMSKEEVLAAVQKRGYKFSTKDPLNSLGVILYGRNPKFNRENGKFSLPGGFNAGGSSAGSRPGGASSGGGGKRSMSPEARARIAEAQRRRWAASRKGK